MNDTFLRIIIIGLPFGFSLMWFTYWAVKIYKGSKKKKALEGKADKGPKGKATPPC